MPTCISYPTALGSRDSTPQMYEIIRSLTTQNSILLHVRDLMEHIKKICLFFHTSTSRAICHPEYEIRNKIDFDKPLYTYARMVTELFHVQDFIIRTRGHKQEQRM